MIFWLFRRKRAASSSAAEKAASGFASLLDKIRDASSEEFGGFEDLSKIAALPFTLLAVSLAVRVLINVHLALKRLTATSSDSNAKQNKTIQPHNTQKSVPKRPKSVHSRPLLLQRRKRRPTLHEEDDASSSASSDSFTFIGMRSPTPDVSLNGDEMLFSHLVSDTQPQRSVSPFARGFMQTFEKDHPDSDPPVSPCESLELNTGPLDDFESSGFDVIHHEPSLRLPDVLELTPQIKQTDDGVLSKGKSELEEPLSDIGEDVELKLLQSKAKGDDPQKTEELETRCVSPCSSMRSNFSDSIAARFVNSNFNNPQFFEEEPTEAVPRTPLGGSIRHRYTMRRLQSMLSRRSTLSPSVDGRATPGRIPPTSSRRSRRSVGPSMSKRWSFRSRDESGGGPQLSDAYSFIRLETCIRKAWHMSTNNEAIEEDVPSMKKQTKPMRSELKSIKKQFSRKPDREAEVSFVHVPLNPGNGFLGTQEDVVLNPYYGADAPLEEDGSSEGGNTIDANSVVLRTPLQRIAPIDENYTRCEKNLEEGLYDNPLELCSFRSYDSDTELELTSFRFRNPISKLLDLDRVRGVSKDGIALAELEGNDCSLAMLKEVGKCPIQESMMDKYLTQLVINDAIEQPSNEDGGWATCQEEMVPQELDSDLRCFLLERFLLDNVSHEMDVNLEAMELARVQQRRPLSGTRKLRRS